MLATTINKGDTRVICVLVDSIRVTAFERFRRRQWMDFRARRPEHLFALLSALRVPEGPTDGYVYLTPINPERFRAPIGVHAFVNGTRDFVSTFGGAAAGILASPPFHTGDILQAVLSALLLGSVVVLHDRTTKRRLTGLGFGLVAGAASVLAAMTWYLGRTWLPARNTPTGGGHSSVGAAWFTALTPLQIGVGFAWAASLSVYAG